MSHVISWESSLLIISYKNLFMRDFVDIKRLFSTYDKCNHSNLYIVTKQNPLPLSIPICITLFSSLFYYRFLK